jgi:SUZ domain
MRTKTVRRSGTMRKYTSPLKTITPRFDHISYIYIYIYTTSRNTKSPMPELIISRTSTSPAVVSPPTTAIQSPLRILKRPSSGSNNNHSSTPDDTPPSSSSTNISSLPSSKTFAEREAKYQAARDRIFGGSHGGDPASVAEASRTSLSPSSSQPPTTSIVRNPRGPSPLNRSSQETTDTTATLRGFAGKRGGKAPV